MEKKQSFLVEEVSPQMTIDEDLGQSVEVLCEGAARVPTVRFDVGQLMQWPDIMSAGVMMDVESCWNRRCLRSVLCGARLSRCPWRLSLKC